MTIWFVAGLSFRDSIVYLSRRAKSARPNFGFQNQLKHFAAKRKDIAHQVTMKGPNRRVLSCSRR